KEVILRIGFDKLAEYDEIILQNDTLFGPVYPLAETFEKMSTLDLDFWGITKYHHEELVPQHIYPKGFISEHINASFIACRSSLVKSVEFQNYWKKLPNFTSYTDVVNNHEITFTEHFEKLGFKWDVSVNTDQIQHKGLCYPLMYQPVELIKDLRCPVFKRRLFFSVPNTFFAYSMGDAPVKLLDYLKEHTDYNTDLVYSNIIRTINPYVLTKNLGLFKSLPRNYVKSSVPTSKQKIALIMHSYFTDLVPYLLGYAANMPENADIYITTDSKEKKQEIQKEFDKSDIKCGKFEIRVIENRGRDVGALLVGGADLVNKYDLICFMHDKKGNDLKSLSIGKSWSDKLFECNLASKEYVQNLINKFANDKFLGMTFPYLPFHAEFFPLFYPASLWNPNGQKHGNYSEVLKLLKKMNIGLDLYKERPPIFPCGTMFWFKTDALKKLFDMNWKYEDFPQEPNKLDGTILHAIERSYASVAQGSGYYSSYMMPDDIAAIEYNSLNVVNNRLNNLVLDLNTNKSDSYANMLHYLNSHFIIISRIRSLYGKALRILVVVYHKMIGKK
ncbi:MAG: rhamnan synthesis F family protein, partial [Candidatus Ancillula sp.]|nr:rhamnan synthesis F family protein [Candidatus Ancillula sp.]